MRIISDEVKQLIKNYLDQIIEDAKANAPVATGKLRDSYDSAVINDSEKVYEAGVVAESYHKWVDNSRGAGKPPPVAAIRAWTQAVGLPVSAAFPIARAIGKNGTTAKPYVSNYINSNQSSFETELDLILGSEVDEYMIEIIKQELPNFKQTQ